VRARLYAPARAHRTRAADSWGQRRARAHVLRRASGTRNRRATGSVRRLSATEGRQRLAAVRHARARAVRRRVGAGTLLRCARALQNQPRRPGRVARAGPLETRGRVDSLMPVSFDSTALANLAVAFLGGLAVGIERERSGHALGPHARFAGVRT